MEKLRYLNKGINANERYNFSRWWKEQIEINGQEIEYYYNNAQISEMNPIYGEQPDTTFQTPKPMVVLLNLNNDSYLLSKFGIVADSDMNGVIHPEHFTYNFGVSSEPKAGDLIKMSEFGSDRLNFPKRGPTVYEITEVIDEFQLNAIAGHYVWFFKAKRNDYSHETGSAGSGDGNIPNNDNDIIEQASKNNFDYLIENPCSDTSVYGDY
jgi:hypothetical protein